MDIELIKVLKNGGVAVIPTDTMYGVVGSAMNKKTVEKIYNIRKRNKTKPFIILISSLSDITKFGIKDIPEKFLKTIWPDKVTVILPCISKKLDYLHRGQNKIGFRLPRDKGIISLLKKTGPLVAPSANLEGEKPSKNIKEAEEYFGASVDLYIDGGTRPIKPSTIIEILGNNDIFEVKLVRKGAVNIKI